MMACSRKQFQSQRSLPPLAKILPYCFYFGILFLFRDLPKRVLVVDDESDITDTLFQGLTFYGYEVKTYNDPLKALAYFKADAYDVVILDYKMNGLDGFALYEKLILIDRNPKFCFLSATEYLPKIGETLKPDLKEARFMRKPIAIKELVRRLEEMFAT